MSHRVVPWWCRIGIVAVVLMGGCGSEDAGESGSTTTTVAESSRSTSSTVSPGQGTTASTTPQTSPSTAPAERSESSASSTPQSPEFVVQFDSGGQPLFPESLPGSGGAAGSGCVPGGDVLPDGIWFGFVEATNATDLTFDLACMWVGAAAEREAAADGEEVTQDYYLENRNPRTFVVPISETSRVWDAPLGQAALAETSLEAWLGADCQVNPQPWCPSVWLYVNDGQVTSIVKQFRP